MFSITKHYKIWFIFSGTLVLASLLCFILWGLPLGIDFRGGTQAKLQFKNSVNSQEVATELGKAGYKNVVAQPIDDRTLIVKTEALSEAETEKFKTTLEGKFGEYEETSFQSIGPTIGRELLRKAYWQIGLVITGIVLYIAYAFRKISKLAKKTKISSWQLGVATIIALIHDLAIPIGLFAVLGKFRGVEVDSLFITALLTILGFSVHDTIVVFDRIRENVQKFPHKSLQTIIDYSVSSTLARSINTSSTLIFVLIAMLFFGGQSIFYFVLALLVGVIFGTYSSIFIASPILYFWKARGI